MTKQIIIKKVYMNKNTKQKLITIPKDCDLEAGDYVSVKKVKLVI